MRSDDDGRAGPALHGAERNTAFPSIVTPHEVAGLPSRRDAAPVAPLPPAVLVE
ncbi:hypothetical protein AB0387_30315 [Streptomyces sp. NPDC089173]|uniref:hypothetical protein n=1 Tax=Streptomyces sp. NPDC089173 TaxID=3154965 RepID=UPI00344DF13D